jgi:hypothetical protein
MNFAGARFTFVASALQLSLFLKDTSPLAGFYGHIGVSLPMLSRSRETYV